MELKKPSVRKRLRHAAAADGLSFVCGLSPVPIPIESIKALIDIAKRASPLHYVDWELADWPTRYWNERSGCVSLLYKGEKYLLPQALLFENKNHNFALSRVRMHLKPESFELRPEVRALTEGAFQKLEAALPFTNEQNLRLAGLRVDNSGLELAVQCVWYRDYVHTNLVLDAHRGNKHQSLREFLHHDGRLEPLEESPLANNLGVNILLWTADGSLIVQRRSKKVAFRRGELCPSVSGTLSLTDVPGDITLDHMYISREGFEEIGIGVQDVPKESIVLLGITREFIRGGEAEMFFAAQTHLSQADVSRAWKSARDRHESKKLLFFHFGDIAIGPLKSQQRKFQFYSALDEFIDTHISKASIPLLTNLALWAESRCPSD